MIESKKQYHTRQNYNSITIDFHLFFSSTRILSDKNEMKRDDADANVDNESSDKNKVLII